VQLSETGVLLPRDTRHWSPSPPRLGRRDPRKSYWLGLRSPISPILLQREPVVELAHPPLLLSKSYPAGTCEYANIA